jgi:hypothetical protein
MRIVSLTLLLLIFTLTLYPQKIHTSLKQIWDNNAWEDSQLDTYSYDSRGLLATKTIQQWSAAAGIWVNSLQETYTYFADSTEQQEISQIWDTDTKTWQNHKMHTTTQLSNGGASILYQKWVKGSWQNDMKIASINDKKGLLTKGLKQKWDAAAGGWVNDILTDYICHRNGKIARYTCQIWDKETNDWSTKRKDECTFSYDKNGKFLGSTDNSMVDSHLQTSNKNINSYDALGYKTSSSFTTWDARSKSWRELMREDYTNNSDGSVGSYISQKWYRSGGEPNSKIMTKYNYF